MEEVAAAVETATMDLAVEVLAGFVEVTDYAVAEATYPITIGGGGSQGMGGYPQNASRRGINGGDTIFTNPSPETITAKGGGGGGTGNSTPSTPAYKHLC